MKIGIKLKGKLYKSVIRPAVLYGIEKMPLTKALEGKINAAEIRVSRFVKGVTRWDKLRNEEIRKSFGVEQPSKKCREVQLRWFDHISRSSDDYVESKITKIIVEIRKRGIPRKRWENAMKIRKNLDW